MRTNKPILYPSLFNRLYSVWYRHFRIYTKNLVSNGLPPFLEPLIFLAGMGLGLSKFLVEMDHLPYIQFLATGLLVTTAMFTAAFECSFGTFIRMEFDKVYDGMLAAPINVRNLLIGEILWAGTKGFFFTFAVLCMLTLFGILPLNGSTLLSPFVGFLTGVMFASISLLITSFVKDINQFNFYFSGFLSPMFFFSGVVFPIGNLPPVLRPVAEIFPLTHTVRLVRAVCFFKFNYSLLLDFLFILVITLIVAYFAIQRLGRKLVT
ncbi:MAG: ABC transporter permease [bacterium]|nr:ABC transporter permease [bacterium]